jgi:hypothetical protein
VAQQPTYDRTPAQAALAAAAVPAPAPRYGWGLAARIVLTLAGAAGLIIGAFGQWMPGGKGTTGSKLNGVDLSGTALFQTTFRDSNSFALTAGFVMIVLGLLAIIGLAFWSGWPTRLAGALGMAGFVLFLIEVYRAHLTVAEVGAGPWICLAGAAAALIGGFLAPSMPSLRPQLRQPWLRS